MKVATAWPVKIMTFKLKFITRNIFLWLSLAVLISVPVSLCASPDKTEAQLIQLLHSQNYQNIVDALDRLPNWYPNSSNAISEIKTLLRSSDSATKTNALLNYVARKAARALGNYHAALSHEDIMAICDFLKSPDNGTVMDGLKALRGLNAPDAVPEILPLLKKENHNVLRDSCRTLAILGNIDTIPFIEPLLKDSRLDVRTDARATIKALSAKK